MLEIKIAPTSPIKEQAECVQKYLQGKLDTFAPNCQMLLEVDDEAKLSLLDSSITTTTFQIDLFKDKLLWRLAHSGKNSEAVCRAVLGKLDKPTVFDATAGLGRESLILQSAGCNVYMFERNPVIWLLLYSAVHSANQNTEVLSQLKNSMPTLTTLGSIKDQIDAGVKLPTPDVVYYDPMFPARTKTALVKKDMRVFHELVGSDFDTVEYANFLLTVASHHVVVKRPSNEKPLELNVRRSSFVDGKACRFDCYYCGSSN